MSILDIFHTKPQGTSTNIAAIQSFEGDLARYEATIKVDSAHMADYRPPAEHMRSALARILAAQPTDVISMMRRLVAHIQGGIDDKYSDYTVSMLATSTYDEKARQLIMGILYTTRELIVGDPVDLNEGWLQLVERNVHVLTFLSNYGRSDQGMDVSESPYGGDAITGPKPSTTIDHEDEFVEVEIGYSNYEVKLSRNEVQTVSFKVAPDIRQQYNASNEDKLVIQSDIIITPKLGYLTLDQSVDLFDDAIAQISAMGCAPQGYITGRSTRIQLPGLFYSLMLSIISYDHGHSWRVSEVNILPPSLSRPL